MNTFILASIFLAGDLCGMDFARAEKDNLPITYCYARQEAGNQTFGGFLKPSCSGDACPKANYTLNVL